MLIRILSLFLLGIYSASAVTNVWFSPGGKGDGSSRGNPRSYYPDLLYWKLLGGDKSIDRTVIMHFLPGEYLIHPIDTETVYASDFRITILGEGARPEDTVLKLVPNYPSGASDGGGNWVSVIDLARNNEYLRRFVMENITIDGNWEGQTNYNHPSYLRSYKNSPVNVSARTGRIRKVIVRNFGAHGLMPQRLNDLGEGVEVFPLFVTTREEGQEPEDGDPCPWLVEECEVTGFNGLYNGYSSCLMGVTKLNVPETPDWAFKDNDRRLIWFRRNQVRGVPQQAGVIALGAAGIGTNYSGRITWSDNVILNGSGFNTDTGALWDLGITNCLFLDVVSLGYLGSPFAGQPSHRRYDLIGNSIRLGGFLFSADYMDFGYLPGTVTPKEDQSLVLGRRRTYQSSGLFIGGIADDIELAGNWFTTRPSEQFRGRFLPEGRDSTFRLVYRMPSKDPNDPKAPSIPRFDALNVDLRGNFFSAVPFDFVSLKGLEGGKVSRLTENASPMQAVRQPAPSKHPFVPAGVIQRVVAFYTNQPRQLRLQGLAVDSKTVRIMESNYVDRVLSGACEVSFGNPSRSGNDGKFVVPVRVAIQPTPLSGGVTRPLSRRLVVLEVLAGSLNPQKLTALTDSEGIAKFTYSVSSERNGMDFFRAWTDFGQGTREEFDEHQDAWATLDYAHGTTVSVVSNPDVCDARNGTPATFRIVRTGRLDRPLTIAFGSLTGPLAAEPGIDFEWTGPGRDRVGRSLTFPTGEREVEIQAKPLPRTARSGRLVTLTISEGEGYGRGLPYIGRAVVFNPGK
ncbi:MAG: hypothetical protein J0M24_18540 [Verrucomicrobia bacterium]|nr:hypothetical protein [Verrucomicrobiota bacterium]